MMILIDAIYINNRGGKILLDYLIEVCEKKGMVVHYLLDARVQNSHPKIIKNKVTYLKGNMLKRHQFYLKNKNSFSKVFCFGNFPPPMRLDAKVYTYFHQRFFLEIPNEIPYTQKIVFKAKILVFKKLQKNTDFWIVQTQAMKDIFLKEAVKIAAQKVSVIPFYSPLIKSSEGNKKKGVFVYVSSGCEHKNHLNLLEAFCQYYDDKKTGELHLTVENEFKELKDFVDSIINKGYPIVNHCFVSRELLGTIYENADFCIYPSLTESFGLGLIEAIECGCNVIGANLPYTYAVCNPSIVFNPLDVNDLVLAFEKAFEKNIKPTEQLVFNEIEALIAILN